MTVLPDFSARPRDHEHLFTCLIVHSADGVLVPLKRVTTTGTVALPTLCTDGKSR